MSSEKKHIRYLRKREKTGQKCHAFSHDEVMVIIKIGQFIAFLRKKGWSREQPDTPLHLTNNSVS